MTESTKQLIQAYCQFGGLDKTILAAAKGNWDNVVLRLDQRAIAIKDPTSGYRNGLSKTAYAMPQKLAEHLLAAVTITLEDDPEDDPEPDPEPEPELEEIVVEPDLPEPVLPEPEPVAVEPDKPKSRKGTFTPAQQAALEKAHAARRANAAARREQKAKEQEEQERRAKLPETGRSLLDPEVQKQEAAKAKAAKAAARQQALREKLDAEAEAEAAAILARSVATEVPAPPVAPAAAAKKPRVPRTTPPKDVDKTKPVRRRPVVKPTESSGPPLGTGTDGLALPAYVAPTPPVEPAKTHKVAGTPRRKMQVLDLDAARRERGIKPAPGGVFVERMDPRDRPLAEQPIKVASRSSVQAAAYAKESAKIVAHGLALVEQMKHGLPDRLGFEYHPEVLALYGLDKDMCEDVLRHPEHVELRPESTDEIKRYVVLGFRKGDVQVILGMRKPESPAVIAVYVDARLVHDTHRVGYAGRGGGGSRAQGGLPKNAKQACDRLRSYGAVADYDPSKKVTEVWYEDQRLGSIANDADRATSESRYQALLRKINAIVERS